jgi:hypothetical protein
LEAVRLVKAALREEVTRHPVPPELSARISGALAAESRRDRLRRRPIAMGLALAAAAALALLLARGGGEDVVDAAARDFGSYRAATLRLDLETSEPATLERHFAGAGVSFPVRVFDFDMMGLRLAGGRVHRLGGRISALFAYQSADGDRVLCQMYPGEIAELPAPLEQRENNGIRFSIYRTADVTLVFWQEGTVVCILVADGDPETAIQLAYAKAVTV